jgi:hypothetical protein
MLDPRALYRKLGVSAADEWLPALFRAAIHANAIPIPVSDLRTIESEAFDGLQAVVRRHTGSMAIRVPFEDLVRADVRRRIQNVLLRLVLKPSDCVLILDFADADLSDPDAAVEVTVAKFQQMMEIGLWGQIIWQATTYPEKNPAQPGSLIELPRNEWSVWCGAVSQDTALKNLMYGDFVADSAKFSFPTGGVAPIPHYRYSTPKLWLVGRGSDGLTISEAMRNISARIVASGHFAGVNFSKGDKYIADTATGHDGPGGPTTWRKVNTIHHLTRMATDIGAYRGYTIAERVPSPEPQQGRLFD